MRRWLIAMLAPLALAGCGGSTFTGEYYSSFYQPELVGHSSRNGAMPTAVYGSPFDAAGTQALLDALRLPAGHPPARLAMTPAAQRGELGRLVMVFDPAPIAADGAKACRLGAGAAPPQAIAAGRTRVLLAFCHGRGLASEGEVTVPNASPPTIPALAEGINLGLIRLLPVTDPNQDRGCGAPC